MKRYTKVILLGSAIGFAPLAAAAESVAVALSASFEPVYAYTELDIVATGTVPGQVVIVTGETDNALGWPVQHDHAVTGTGETSDTDVTVTVTVTASGMMYDGQALTSLSVAAGIGDSAAATAASTQGATSASAASTLDGNPIFLETDFDGRSNAYESAIVIMAADHRPD